MHRHNVQALLVAFLLLPLWGIVPAQAQVEGLGHTTFQNSGAPEAQDAFLRGLLLLHSFEYDDAREAFQEARRIDPDFAMAYWGEAMTYNHSIWFQQDREAALRVLRKLGETPEERLARAPTEREKEYLRALEVLYGEGDKRERDHAYAEAMGRLAAAYPEDLDAAAFHALAILATSHDGRDFATYMRAAAIVEEVFDKNPEHPGAAHYLIHAYDDPIHAPLGLRPARVYARIAPAASHALHMPSHIFVALGMWEEASAANEASWEAARAKVERKNLPVDGYGFHAIWWLSYSRLQQGQYAEARRLVDLVAQLAKEIGTAQARRHLAVMRAAYLVETEQWDSPQAALVIDTSGLGVEVFVADRCVAGLAALKTGRRTEAESALDEIKRVRGEADWPSKHTAAAVMELELDALLRLEEGDAEAAVSLMEQATALEDAMPLEYGPPLPVKPSHELFGEMLLALDRPEEASVEFERALARAPGRARSLLGLARAAMRTGNMAEAREAYDRLQTYWRGADAAVRELNEVLKGTSGVAGDR